MQYAGMVTTMGVMLALGAWVGKKLDAYYMTERPYLTILCVVLALFLSFYLVLKDIPGNRKK